MGSTAQRIVGAVGSVAVAAIVNIATGFITGKQEIAWWAFGIALLVVGVAVQWQLPVPTSLVRERRHQVISDTRVGGSVRQSTDGPAVQETVGSEITGDLSQDQHG